MFTLYGLRFMIFARNLRKFLAWPRIFAKNLGSLAAKLSLTPTDIMGRSVPTCGGGVSINR